MSLEKMHMFCNLAYFQRYEARLLSSSHFNWSLCFILALLFYSVYYVNLLLSLIRSYLPDAGMKFCPPKLKFAWRKQNLFNGSPSNSLKKLHSHQRLMLLQVTSNLSAVFFALSLALSWLLTSEKFSFIMINFSFLFSHVYVYHGS